MVKGKIMKKNNPIDLLFAATSDFLPYAIVTALSVIHNTKGRPVSVHFMYADIVKPVDKKLRKQMFKRAEKHIRKHKSKIFFYDVSKYIYLFNGQNIGMWGPEVSNTHYMYLLAPMILSEEIKKVIYLDTDMIVNCDLSSVFDCTMKDNLIGMGAPRGFEEMGDDVSNSGFVVLNLYQWRKENTLKELLHFGRKLPRARFCDQYLLYNYFTKKHCDRLMLFDKEYNIFPQLFPEIPLSDIKILHFTGWNHIKPWNDKDRQQRGSDLWWKYAKKSPLTKYITNKQSPLTRLCKHIKRIFKTG